MSAEGGSSKLEGSSYHSSEWEHAAAEGRLRELGFVPTGIEMLAFEVEPDEIQKTVREEFAEWEGVGDGWETASRLTIQPKGWEVSQLKKQLRGIGEKAKRNLLQVLKEEKKEDGRRVLLSEIVDLPEEKREGVIETCKRLEREMRDRITIHNAFCDWLMVRPNWKDHCDLLVHSQKTVFYLSQLVDLGRTDYGPQLDAAMRGLTVIALAQGFPEGLEGRGEEFGGMTFEELTSDQNGKLTLEQKELIREAHEKGLVNIFASPYQEGKFERVMEWLEEKSGGDRSVVEMAIKIFAITNIAATFSITNEDGKAGHATGPLVADIGANLINPNVQAKIDAGSEKILLFESRNGRRYPALDDKGIPKFRKDSSGVGPRVYPGLLGAIPGFFTDAFHQSKVERGNGKKERLWDLWWNNERLGGSKVRLGDLPAEVAGDPESKKTMEELVQQGVVKEEVSSDIMVSQLVKLFFAKKMLEAIATSEKNDPSMWQLNRPTLETIAKAGRIVWGDGARLEFFKRAVVVARALATANRGVALPGIDRDYSVLDQSWDSWTRLAEDLGFLTRTEVERLRDRNEALILEPRYITLDVVVPVDQNGREEWSMIRDNTFKPKWTRWI